MSGPQLVSDTGIAFTLGEGAITVGRPDPASGWIPAVDLTNVDPNRRSSRRHAEIRVAGRAIVLRDLGSANKTFVNGRPLEPNTDQPLSEGDLVVFGGEARLRLQGLPSIGAGRRCPMCHGAVTAEMTTCAACGANLSSTMTVEMRPAHPCFRCGRPTRGEEHCGDCAAAVAEADAELLALCGFTRPR